MVTINLNLSGSAFYKFTEPVRKFKANDPYYYEVDNIPVKQLEENILWLKDAIQNATIDVEQQQLDTGGGSRETFTELQPYVSGTNSNIVSVRSGRFIGRINDAYDLNPLQIIKRVSGSQIGQFEQWEVAAIDNLLLTPTILKFKSLVATNSLGMNGLAERSFGSFVMNTNDSQGATQGNGTAPIYSLFGIGGQNPNFTLSNFLWAGSPRIQTALAGGENNGPGLAVTQYSPGGSADNTQGFYQLFLADTQFIKKWRGVARTAVVDVPEDLSIEIDKFYADDFNYIDEEELLIDESYPGTAPAQATHRIDLLFIYSKPIDTSAVHLATSWTGAVPRKIFKAELGIVRGAGVTLNYYNGSNPTSKFVTPNYEEAILAQYADQLNENLGFKSLDIKGSFPSPDDLMNISPALAEWLPTTHFSLVGQSILPIAYIVVKKNQINENGDQIVEPADIVDIRPFFRTTELTYGERAGLAAALPSVSLANPVATEAFVNYEDNRVKNYIDAQIQQVRTDLSSEPSTQVPLTGLGTVIARGIVRGGNYYGPEGSICRAIQAQYNLNKEETIQKFKELHNLPNNYDFKNLPDWDLANWTYANVTGTTNEYPSIGYGITDRIGHFWVGGAADGEGNYQFGHTNVTANNNKIDFGPFSKNPSEIAAGAENRIIAFPNRNDSNGALSFGYIYSKTISLDITKTQWVNDVTVLPHFWNCAATQPEGRSIIDPTIYVSKGRRRGPVLTPNGNSAPINKYFIDFTIFVVVPTNSTFVQNRPPAFNFSQSNLASIINSLVVNRSYAPPFAYRRVLPNALYGAVIGKNNLLGSIAFTALQFHNFIVYSHCMHWKDNGDPWVSNSTPRYGHGGIGLALAVYPSVEFTVIGHPQRYTGDATAAFPNNIHKVPGINSHENYNSNSRVDRASLEASDTMPTSNT